MVIFPHHLAMATEEGKGIANVEPLNVSKILTSEVEPSGGTSFKQPWRLQQIGSIELANL